MEKNIYMGIDISTQSISVSFLEIEGNNGQIVLEQSFPYIQFFENDSNCENDGAMLLPREKEGEAMHIIQQVV